MRISRSRHLKINMGNWENLETGGTYTLDHGDLGLSDEDANGIPIDDLFDRMISEVERGLTKMLRADVLDASNLTDEKKSFILQAHALGDMPATPTRQRKSRR